MIDIPIFPVTGWLIDAIPEEDVVIIRLAFLSHAQQTPEESDPGRIYGFRRAQLVEFRDAINRIFQKLESNGAPKSSSPMH